MHIVFKENHGLDGLSSPFDVDQEPADLIFLSFSDSDLGAFAAGWQRAKHNSLETDIPSLRLANLSALAHPLSVDTYMEKTASKAKGILVRLIGGKSYWSYGLMYLQELARKNKIALAVLPGDGRDDSQLDKLSTVPISTLRQLKVLCDHGGEIAAQAALSQLAIASGLYLYPVLGNKEIPNIGFYCANKGYIGKEEISQTLVQDKEVIFFVFYRSYLTSADTAPVNDMMHAFRLRGINCFGIFVNSLKDKKSRLWMEQNLHGFNVKAIINGTAFSAKGNFGDSSPLESFGCPVFQISFSTARKSEWDKAERGLSPADLAMYVALPELDGNLYAGTISFKSPSKRDPDLQYSRFCHVTSDAELSATVEKILAWIRLGKKENKDKNLFLVLSTYPSKEYQIGHAVGLDTMSSACKILNDLILNQFSIVKFKNENLSTVLAKSKIKWSLKSYLDSIEELPEALRKEIFDVWGHPCEDPLARNNFFEFNAIKYGKVTVALQPDRGLRSDREAEYHNLSKVPCHSYVAFYLWCRSQKTDALIHLGAHGTLEWLPGKSVALSDTCWPRALVNDVPVIYPFIVNDPGEAAQAKRRLCAVTLGHLPPKQIKSKVPDSLLALESLLDEYSTADGLDPQRKNRLASNIRLEAEGLGLNKDLGIAAEDAEAYAVTRIDSFVCDIKATQFGEGLHTYGEGKYGEYEMNGLQKALAGQFVPAGPSGSPFRGKSNVLPTGRNIYTVDPRSIPSKAAYQQGIAMANEFLVRSLQDNGDYPKGIIMDLWGSATMRTAGEEFSMALHLAGVTPTWDKKSDRVDGFEIIPLPILDRPRINVSLRVSGMFRDVFPILAQMFDMVVEALVEKDEPVEDNPYVSYEPKVFAPEPGCFGVNMSPAVRQFGKNSRDEAGLSWLSGSSWTLTKDGAMKKDFESLKKQICESDTYLHIQDMPETDLLLASDYAAHEGGFSAAVSYLGYVEKHMYHLDSTNPHSTKTRSLQEEIAKVVRSRASNTEWIEGMMNHGFRGAAEIAETLDNMASFAQLTNAVPSHLFDLYYSATLGNKRVNSFLASENPLAVKSMEIVFEKLKEKGYWVARRNFKILNEEVAFG